MKNSEILKEAKQNIVKYGWRQNGYGSKEEGFCALGSFHSILDRLESVGTAEEYLRRILRRRSDGRYGAGDIVAFNDEKNRTKEEVLALFDEAIAKAEEVGD